MPIRYRCVLCSCEWEAPLPNNQPDRLLVSHGVCKADVPIYEAWIDGYLSNAPVEAVKAIALKLRKERLPKRGKDGRTR